MITIETDRFILRELNIEDATNIFNYSSLPEVSRYMTWNTHKSIQDTINFLNYVIEQYKSGYLEWGLWHKKDQKIIGTIGFIYREEKNFLAELGYCLSNIYWGKGLMPEALMAVIKYAFKELNINRLVGRTNVHNQRSIRVLEKVGFVYEGTLRQSEFCKGEFVDTNMYSILKNEWEILK